MNSIIIYRHNGAGNMYLCADGTLSGDKSQACEHWEIQFPHILKENWICYHGGIASYEYSRNTLTPTSPNWENTDVAYLTERNG